MLQKLQSGAWMPSRWAKQRPVITGGCLAHTVFQPSRLHPGPDEVSWLVQVATLDTHHLPFSQSHPLSSPSLPLQDLRDLSLFSFMRDAISLSAQGSNTAPHPAQQQHHQESRVAWLCHPIARKQSALHWSHPQWP